MERKDNRPVDEEKIIRCIDCEYKEECKKEGLYAEDGYCDDNY